MPPTREHSHRGSAGSRSSHTVSRFQPLHRRSIPKSDKGSADLSRFSFKSDSRDYLALRDDIVQELKLEDAKTAAFYEPRTIARDILIAASKHPTSEGLNNHLEILRTSFREVNIRSDLSTFRWDIIDSCEDPQASRADPQSISTTMSPNKMTVSPSSLKERFAFSPKEHPKKVSLKHFFAGKRIDTVDHDMDEAGLEGTPKRTEFECKWLDCDQLFIQVAELVSHVRESHVMGSPTRRCSWTNCGKVQPMSTSGLWEHVLEAHVKSSTLGRNGLKIEYNASEAQNCKWESCNASFSNAHDLRDHILHQHVKKGLSGPCDWFNCDCFQPMSPLDLWEHVLSTHLPFFTGDER